MPGLLAFAWGGMTKNHEKRRQLIRALGTGGIVYSALPGEWRRPIVKAVLLPAHAQSSLAVYSIECLIESVAPNTGTPDPNDWRVVFCTLPLAVRVF